MRVPMTCPRHSVAEQGASFPEALSDTFFKQSAKQAIITAFSGNAKTQVLIQDDHFMRLYPS